MTSSRPAAFDQRSVCRAGRALRRPGSSTRQLLSAERRRAATCGFLLFSSKAEEYYYNAFFQTKVLLFILVAIHALVFRQRVYGNPAELDPATQRPLAKLAASLSIFLWLGILCAGRGIGYVAGRPGMHYR